jgi:transposase
MVQAVARGQDQASIAAWRARAVRTVRRWRARCRRAGLAALPAAARSGRPAQAAAS